MLSQEKHVLKNICLRYVSKIRAILLCNVIYYINRQNIQIFVCVYKMSDYKMCFFIIINYQYTQNKLM